MESNDIQGPQPMRREWFGSLFDLLDRTFRSGGVRSMRTDFPFFLRTANAANLFVCRAEGKVVSHMGYLPTTLSYFGHPVRIGMVGAVATDPEWRGQGLATKSLHYLFDKARQRRICMLMISGQRGLYLRNGALSAGRFAEYTLPSKRISEATAEIEPAGPEDAIVMGSLHRTKSFRLIRPLKMWEKLIAAKICHNHPADYWIVREHNRPTAYFTLLAEPAGETGAGRVYEYGGVMEQVLAGIKKAASGRRDISDIVLSTYTHEISERLALENAGARLNRYRTMQGTLRIIDFKRLMSSLLPYIEETAGSDIAAGLQFGEISDGLFEIGCGPDSVRIRGHAPLADFLFRSGTDAMEGALAGKEKLKANMERLLPLPAPKYDMSYT